MIYRRAQIQYATHRETGVQQCEVAFRQSRIVVSYSEGTSFKVYEGTENGVGHYRLEAKDGDGTATLHQFPSAPTLEGSWEEGGYSGWWTIDLGPVG
jgi:hypothetical protein